MSQLESHALSLPVSSYHIWKCLGSGCDIQKSQIDIHTLYLTHILSCMLEMLDGGSGEHTQ